MVYFLSGEWIFLLATVSELALGPTQSNFWLVSGVKWLGNEGNNPPSVKVMNGWNCYLDLPFVVAWCMVLLQDCFAGSFTILY